MDAAAKHIQLLRSDILPPLPYQLAKALDKPFRVPPDEVRAIEERHHRQLQYMTLINADRGLLFTRAYYDMREEAPKPNAAREGSAFSEKKPKTKLSLSDYKNKKKVSTSPPDTGAPTTKPSGLRKEIVDVETEASRRDDSRLRESESSRDRKLSRPQDAPNDERSHPKIIDQRSRSDLNGTPEKRKRMYDDEVTRLPKKPKPEATTPQDDRSRTPRDDAKRREDRQAPAQSKDNRHATASSLPNGRGMLKHALGSQGSQGTQSQSATPVSRARGDSINGHRPTSTASSKVTPSKPDSSSRTAVPPLLSPLHFSLGTEESSPPKERRQRDEAEEPFRSLKSAKSSTSAPLKRERPRLPTLLSPTLPPQIEEELALEREGPQKTGSSAAVSRSGQTADSLGNAKKSRPIKEDDREEKERSKVQSRDTGGEDRPQRFIVTLKCPKKHAKAFKRLLALPRPRKERSASLEAPNPGGGARKRPLGASEYIGESIAVKRPRMSDVSSSTKLPPPSTPAKAATSMARAASNNSQAQTPGEMNTFTPSDRPPTRQDPLDASKVRPLRERHERFKNIGNKLKHKRDDLLSGRNDRPADRYVKLGIALCLESAMAYMVSFRAIFESRRLENKAQDPKTWDSILPMLDMIRHHLADSRHRALEALFHHLRGVILEELIKCYWSLDPSSNAHNVMHYERMRSSTWKAAGDAARNLKNSRMSTGFGPWTGAEEAVVDGLKIVQRWADEENVDWSPEFLQQMNGH